MLLYDVSTVNVSVIKTLPTKLEITAKGHSNTGGWTNVQLQVMGNVKHPPIGVITLALVGNPPNGPSTPVLEEHTAVLILDPEPADWNSVVVYSETNRVENTLI